MTLIPKRHQVSAVSVGGGERVTGYYAHVGYTGNQKHYIIPEYASAFYGIEIDPDTIEPVRMKPVKVYDDYMKQDRFKCPNCKRYTRIDDNFCQWKDCGQALDWSNE